MFISDAADNIRIPILLYAADEHKRHDQKRLMSCRGPHQKLPMSLQRPILRIANKFEAAHTRN
jgi:hypothetical protein